MDFVYTEFKFLSDPTHSAYRSADGGSANLTTDKHDTSQVLSTYPRLWVISKRIVLQLPRFVKFMTCVTDHSRRTTFCVDKPLL